MKELDDVAKKLLKLASDLTSTIGYTDHGARHSFLVSKRCTDILIELGFDNRLCELGQIAGMLHDIGNSISRKSHAEIGSIIAINYLMNKNYSLVEALKVASAISNHNKAPLNELSAALVIADKSDINRNRVQKNVKEKIDKEFFDVDIHNMVNYSIINDEFIIDKKNRLILLKLEYDFKYSKIVDFFELFGSKMRLCQKGAKKLDAEFKLIVNDKEVL